VQVEEICAACSARPPQYALPLQMVTWTAVQSGLVTWVPAAVGKVKAGWLISTADERWVCSVKLWDPLRTRAIPERFCGGDSLRRGAISSVRTFTLPLPFDFLTVKLVKNVGTENLPANFGYATFRCRVTGIHARDWRLVGLPVPKIWLIFGHDVKRPDDLDLGPWPWNWRRMSARTTFFPIVGASATVVVELRTNVHRTDTTWPYCIDLWLIWRQSACRWCGSSYSIPVPSLKFVAASFGRYGAFSVSALIGLVTLTSDLSTSKRGHGSPVSWASLVPMFCLLRPAFDLRHGRDGQTNNGHQRF